jgi:C-terminal processing protease CtpA/Prc
MKLSYRPVASIACSFLLLLILFLNAAAQDQPKLSGESKRAREYALGMLSDIETILKEEYYDQKFHGIDLKARIQAAKDRVKTLQYNWQMYRVLAQVLLEFDDSHTRLLLPGRSDHFDYGVDWQMVGDTCFVTDVKRGSDAAGKGVEVGDEIAVISQFPPSRRDLWKINYLLYKLDPSDTLPLTLKKPDGTVKTVTITAKTQTDKEYEAELKAKKTKSDDDRVFKCQEVNPTVIACKLYTFSAEKSSIDKLMKVASKYPKLILDLRGNGGGLVETEVHLISYFFDHDVKIADLVHRGKPDARVTKHFDTAKQYKGEVAVVVDSFSASASEMTAKVLQLEKRAKIYGDNSSGSVMTSITVPFTSVMSALYDAAIIKVGMSVTVGDVIMSDGSRLEKVGITPDVLARPTGISLKNELDVALSSAAAGLGAELPPDKAGKFYFLTDPEDDTTGKSPKGN